ncbi:MAG: hypothetical protein K9N49_06705, partial [Candidatus Marinimicrobia bacterium]|nr:hypothetical protein [Candidatus Neomarinimicrobiota bacterium]
GHDMFEPYTHPNSGVTMMAIREGARKPHSPWAAAADRMPDAANVAHDERLYSLLYRLSEVTGEQKYAAAADEALRFFWLNCQDPNTGLMAWGEHLGWHLPGGTWMTTHDRRRNHELWTAWPHFERSYALGDDVTAAINRFAQGSWRYQVGDHERALWCRHCHVDSYPNTARTGSEYPRLIGQMGSHWARAYAHSTDEEFRAEMLRALDSMISNSLARRTPHGAVTAGTSERNRQFIWVAQNVRAAAMLHENVLPVVEGELREKVQEFIRSQRDFVLAALDHPLTPDRGFIGHANAETLESDHHGGQASGDTGLWTGTAGFALELLDFDQTADDPEVRALALAGAALYLADELPEFPEERFLPLQMAQVIELMLRAYALTGDEHYLARAERFGHDAQALFFDGRSPLPTVLALNAYGRQRRAERVYETVTGGDDLMYALLQLHLARKDT